MGDDWEEQRLERREQFRDSHRLRLDSKTSSALVGHREVIDVLTNELLEAVKQLRSALKSVSRAPKLDGSETLRNAFAKYVKEPAIMEGDTGTEYALVELTDLSRGFGDAISAIMTINRCVMTLNREKLAYSSLRGNIHKQAVAQTGSAAEEFVKQAIQVELENGELFTVPPDVEITPLASVSMDLTINQLANRKAVEGKQGSWRAGW
jgi:hypothetical protein